MEVYTPVGTLAPKMKTQKCECGRVKRKYSATVRRETAKGKIMYYTYDYFRCYYCNNARRKRAQFEAILNQRTA